MTQMHANEVLTSAEQVRRLLAAQFPQWANLPVRRVASSGTDNAIYRLGDDLVARLPRIDWAVGQVAREQRWLPHLAPHLPLAIPEPLALGAPGEGYPWPWSVYRWLEGDILTADCAPGPDTAQQLARQLAEFIRALQAIDATGGPLPGGENSARGLPLADLDDEIRVAIGQLANDYDTAQLMAVWEASLAVPVWAGTGVWIHGDLQDSNLLLANGRLCAVIDFGCLGVGDPAADVMAAWKLFSGAAREAFRAALAIDEATWLRGRGWALATGVMAVPYYRHTNPVLAAGGRRAIDNALADFVASARAA